MCDIKLFYFDAGRGRVEPIVLTLVAAGKKFEDYRFDAEKHFLAEQAKSPYGQFPYMEYKGKSYGESKAIASFVARHCGMAGRTEEEVLRVDAVYCLAGTLLDELFKSYSEKDATKKAELQKKEVTELVPKFLSFFEKIVTENGSTGFIAGSALTLGDLSVFDITDTILQRYPTALDKYPGVQQVRKNVESNANVKAYLATRKQTDM